ncbi:MAG: hypothetical protein WC304_03610 [Candidatus Gracilibacteria bacterium]|jgi:hypothetical protein
MGKIPFYNGFAGRDSGFAEKRRVFLDTDGKTSEQLEKQILDAIKKEREKELGTVDVITSIREAFASQKDLTKRIAEVDAKIKIAGSTPEIAEKWRILKIEGLKQMRAKEEILKQMQESGRVLRTLDRASLKLLIDRKAATIQDSDVEKDLQDEAAAAKSEFLMSKESLAANSEISWVFDSGVWAKDKTDEDFYTQYGEKKLKQRLILRKLLRLSDLQEITTNGDLSAETRVLLYHLKDDNFVNQILPAFAKTPDWENGNLKSECLPKSGSFAKLLEEVTGNPELAKKKKEADKKKTEAEGESEKIKKALDGDGSTTASGIRGELDELEKEKKAQQDKIGSIDEKLGKLAEIKTKEVEEASATSKLASTTAKLQRLRDEKEQLPNQPRIQKIDYEISAINEEIATLNEADNAQTSRLKNSRRLSSLAAKGGLNSDQITNLKQQLKDLENRADNLRAEDAAYARAKETAITESDTILKDEEEKLTVIQAQLANLRGGISGVTDSSLKSQKRDEEKELKKIERKISEKDAEIEKKEKALKEAKEKLEEAEVAVEAASKEMLEWDEANADKSKKLSAEEIARIGKAAVFASENNFEKDIADRAARLRINTDILAAREGEATKRNLEFLEGVAAGRLIFNSRKHKILNFATLGWLGAVEDFKTPMRGKKLIDNLAKEFKQEGKLEMHLNYRELAKLKLSEEQLVLLYGACEHALKTEKLDIGDRVALSRLSSNAKRLILQARVGTDRENESIEKISIADYNKVAKGVKDEKDEKHGESHEGGEGHSDKKSMLDRYNAGGKALYGKFLGRLAAKKGGGGAAHKEH